MKCDTCNAEITVISMQPVHGEPSGNLYELLGPHQGTVGYMRRPCWAWCVNCGGAKDGPDPDPRCECGDKIGHIEECEPRAARRKPASLTHEQALVSPCTHAYPCPRHLAEQDRDRPANKPRITYRRVGVRPGGGDASWEMEFTITGKIRVRASCGVEALRIAHDMAPRDLVLDGTEIDMDLDTPEIAKDLGELGEEDAA